MKQSKHYRQTFQESVGYEADSKEHSTPTPSVHFDFASVYAADEGVDADAAAHGPTRDEAEARLRAQRFSEADTRLVLGRVFDRTSVRQLAPATGKSKSWVAARLKNSKIKQAITELRNGQAVPTAESQRPRQWIAVPKFWPLYRCTKRVQMEMKTLLPVESLADPLFQRVRRGEATAQDVIEAVRGNPTRLLTDYWQPLTQRFVDVCNAALFGFESKDVVGLTRNAAQKALAALGKANRGR